MISPTAPARRKASFSSSLMKPSFNSGVFSPIEPTPTNVASACSTSDSTLRIDGRLISSPRSSAVRASTGTAIG